MSTLEKQIVHMVMVRPEGVTFQELSCIDGFSGDTRVIMASKRDVPHNVKLVVWESCSENAVWSIESLVYSEVIRVDPIDPFKAMVLYSNGAVPGLPVYSGNKKISGCYWTPCVVNQGVYFQNYVSEMNLTGKR